MNRYILIGPIMFILIWALAAWLHLIDSFFLPTPWATFDVLIKLFGSGVIFADLFSTLERVGLAFGISAVIGVSSGLLLGSSRNMYSSVEFLIEFFRSMPASAMFPMFLLIFGATDASKIAVTTFASSIIIIFNTAHGIMHSRQSRILAVRLMGASRLQIFYYILIWESLPQTLIGLRNAVSWSLILIVLTEMFVGSTTGLGRRIIDAQITYEIPTMYAVILLTGIVGYALNFLFVLIESKFLHWGGK